MAIGEISHFDVHCDDVERARSFYERVFGWQGASYSGVDASEFQQLKTPDGKTIGAVQARKFNPAAEKILGWECSIAVADIDATTRAAETAGGKVLMRKAAIPGVGWISKFLDTEGNLFCAVQPDQSAH